MGFVGVEDLTGMVVNGCLHVLRVVRLQPIAYECACARCGCSQVHTHVALRRGAGCMRGLACRRIAQQRATDHARGVRDDQQRQAEVREVAATAQRKAERLTADQEWELEVNTEYVRYAIHATGVWKQPPEKLIPLELWFRIGDHGRERVLERIKGEQNGE